MANYSVKDQQKMLEKLMEFKHDPLGFVMFAFPWGVTGTPLADVKQPRQWQIDELLQMGTHCQEDRGMSAIGLASRVYYTAVSSGRGPGKSAFLSMISLWVLCCHIGATVIITANTESQLRSRTMAEVGKWFTMLICAQWFEKSSMSVRPTKEFASVVKDQLNIDTQYYYIEGQPWSKDNPDAFAGAHSQIGMAVLYDEASNIDPAIWDVTEGFFTDLSPLRVWACISNPRRNTGRFFECFHPVMVNNDSTEDVESFWHTRTIDSRDVEGTDRAVYQRIANKYGEDSDITRVEVKGQFPRTGSNQFIGREVVDDACIREMSTNPHILNNPHLSPQLANEPLIMGVDVARFGDDESCIVFRHGRDARSRTPLFFKGLDMIQLGDEVATLIDTHNPDAVFVDGGGVGGGVIDYLNSINYKVIEVQFGERAEQPDTFQNKRVECWSRMRDWLEYGCLPDQDLSDRYVYDLTGPAYDYDQKNRLKLESKADMKKRGIASPDLGDALAITFAKRIAKRNRSTSRRSMRSRVARAKDMDYDVFNYS